MRARKQDDVMTVTGTGDARVKQIVTMPFGDAQLESENEMTPTGLPPLKNGACCEEGSGEK